MGGRLAAAAPIGVSLLAHGVLVAAAAWVGGPATPAARPDLPAPASPETATRLVLLAPPEPAEDPVTVISLDDPDPLRRPYLDRLRARIWRRWEAPRLAPGKEPRGELTVEFTLAPGGKLEGAAVTEGSGTAALDEAALAAVRAAVPFPPVPEQVAAGRLRVRARFLYE